MAAGRDWEAGAERRHAASAGVVRPQRRCRPACWGRRSADRLACGMRVLASVATGVDVRYMGGPRQHTTSREDNQRSSRSGNARSPPADSAAAQNIRVPAPTRIGGSLLTLTRAKTPYLTYLSPSRAAKRKKINPEIRGTYLLLGPFGRESCFVLLGQTRPNLPTYLGGVSQAETPEEPDPRVGTFCGVWYMVSRPCQLKTIPPAGRPAWGYGRASLGRSGPYPPPPQPAPLFIPTIPHP